MSETLKNSRRLTLRGVTNAISLPESAAGPSPSSLPDGAAQSGQPRSLARHLARRANEAVWQTPDTYGPLFTRSSASFTLQQSLANRLRRRLDLDGSMEYSLTWSDVVTPAGRQYCRLRASARRISDNGFTGELDGWKSPKATEGMGRYSQFRGKRYPGLWMQTQMAGWPTPNTMEGGQTSRSGKRKGEKLMGGLVGWPTPNAMPENRGGLQSNPEAVLKRRAEGHMLNLDDAATLAGWPTPMAGSPATEDYNEAGDTCNSRKTKLLVGWATPTTRDHKDGASDLTNVPINSLLGRQVSLSTASTEKRGALNPEFSRWLMGFPPEWGSCAPTAMPSSRKSRRNS